MENQLAKEFDNELFKADYNEFKNEIRTLLNELLTRNNDIMVKVINGKTQERLASELIGEMYLEMKDIKRHTVPEAVKNIKQKVTEITSYVTLILIIITFLKVWIK